MDKAALRNFAMYARKKLIQDIKHKAAMLGITDEGIKKPLSKADGDMYVFDTGTAQPYKIYGSDIAKYNSLVKELKSREKLFDYKTAYNDLIEEVAYTWFYKLITVRFMEVNNYLPDEIRVLSSSKEGVREPEIVTYYYKTSLNLNDEELKQLEEWKNDGSAESKDAMFRLLFIKQCNALNKDLPQVFEKVDNYAELLLTISYNDPDGVVYKLVHDIKEEYFDVKSPNGQVEIVGWLYQFYHTEPRDEVINIISRKTVKKQHIPDATQIFTPDWVVRYMVDNSLGRYWLERNPDSNIKDSLEYLMPGEIPVIDDKISPEDIKVFDNAMGSGHCLCYAFDVLLKIYESEGYTAREAARLIVEKNLYGLDIDKRVYQLAYFTIVMKVRQHNEDALCRKLKNNLAYFEDSTNINIEHLNYLGLNMDKEDRKKALAEIKYLIEAFQNAEEIGSITRIDDFDRELVLQFINDYDEQGQITFGQINIQKTQKQLRKLVKIASMLRDKYHVMVTNPPYLNKFDKNLKKYVRENYNDYKGDLFSVFIYNNIEMCKKGGYSAYMTPFVWMFIKTYEKLRKYIIENKHISSLIQMEYSAFEEATVPICTFVLQNSESKEKGKYIKLSDFPGGMEVQRVKTLEAIENPNCGYYYETDQNNFTKIPGMPIAYWVGGNFIANFDKGIKIEEISDYTGSQNKTANNDKYLRYFWEVKASDIGQNKNWIFYAKGGDFRKYYGNLSLVIDWSNEARHFYKTNPTSNLLAPKYWYREGITYTMLTSRGYSFRYFPPIGAFDMGGPTICYLENLKYILGLLNSKVIELYLSVLNPTLNLQMRDIKSLPIIIDEDYLDEVEALVAENISIAKIDWDSFETSWEFKIHPLLDKDKQKKLPKTIESAYENWKEYANNNFAKLKENEERLNDIFIEIYGLQEKLTPDVSHRDVTVTKIFDTKDEIYDQIKGNRYILTKEEVIKSFISYGVGCIFGRYSLDVEGLAYAGGEWDDDRYKSFKPVQDNVIIITDEDYYIEDITFKFVEFVEAAFGSEHLEENLGFIAQALGGKGEPREVIRNYFLKDFYKDHVRTYQKRPIYWLYDSGRQNGFKALIYMHRYDEDTTGKLRVDYLHEMQKLYERNMKDLKDYMANSKNAREIAQAEKRLEKLTKQLKECKDYDQKIAHLALRRISIDLNDGVKINHEKVQTDENNRKLRILARI